MYWLIDLQQPGLGTKILQKNVEEKIAETITNTQIVTDDPDLSYLATIIKSANLNLYSEPLRIEDVLKGKISTETIKGIRHYFLLGDRFEVVAKLVNMGKYFKLRGIMGSATILTKEFRLGQPYD